MYVLANIGMLIVIIASCILLTEMWERMSGAVYERWAILGMGTWLLVAFTQWLASIIVTLH